MLSNLSFPLNSYAVNFKLHLSTLDSAYATTLSLIRNRESLILYNQEIIEDKQKLKVRVLKTLANARSRYSRESRQELLDSVEETIAEKEEENKELTADLRRFRSELVDVERWLDKLPSDDSGYQGMYDGDAGYDAGKGCHYPCC